MQLRTLEKALIIGVLTAVALCGFSVSAQNSVSGKLIRLHVKANSDSEYDQALKLKVRDAVLSEIEDKIKDKDLPSAREELKKMLPEIEKTAEEVIKKNNADYPVKATLAIQYFPTRKYESFSLPAGNYESLYIKIGSAAGRNWWCVVFPPLCMAASEGVEVENAAEAAGFTKNDVNYITEDGSGYKVKFKVAEIYGELKHKIFN
ncbi:MAG: stage II sporulation protein R [Clostridiales bacterium]|nr:stage II sporulation protein R [Clostridiales bacterium]